MSDMALLDQLLDPFTQCLDMESAILKLKAQRMLTGAPHPGAGASTKQKIGSRL
jgi:hypothetical protein